MRVLVVDDQQPFRHAAAAVCAATPGVELVGSAKSAEEALDLATMVKPDLVLLDVRLGDVDGRALAELLSRRAPGARIVLCSTYRLEDLCSQPPADVHLLKEDLRPDVLLALVA